MQLSELIKFIHSFNDVMWSSSTKAHPQHPIYDTLLSISGSKNVFSYVLKLQTSKRNII